MVSPPVPNTLADIRAKVRRLTARVYPDQISDAEIDNYVNTYYLYDMPEALRILKLKDTFTFTTIPNVEVYPFDNNNYVTVEPPCFVMGQQVQYFQDPELFYRMWPKSNYVQQVAVGDGTAGPYTGTITGTPFMRSINPTGIIGRDIRVMFSANTTPTSSVPAQAQTAYDNGNGGFIDANTNAPLVGTINYQTGAFTINFSGGIPAGTQINASVIPYAPSAPRSICFFQNQFFMRPIPDKAYIVEVNVFRYPTQFFNSTDTPELKYWWQLLAYGAAIKILVDNGDFENAQSYQPYYEEQLRYVQRRTLKLLSTQRSSTIYSNQGQFPYSNLYPYI